MLECAANLACVGAEPLGTTNNLNFGNPEKPHIAWQLTEAVRGLGDACRALEAPIVGGNVSLYNEGADGPIYPTPVVGMVGVLPDAARAGRLGFARAGDAVALVGWDGAPSLAAGELAKLRGEPLPDGLPAIDVAAVARRSTAIREAVRAGELVAARTTSPRAGSSSRSPSAAWPAASARRCDLGDAEDVWTTLFGERAGGFVVSGPRDALERLGASGSRSTSSARSAATHLEIAVAVARRALVAGRAARGRGALAPLFP